MATIHTWTVRSYCPSCLQYLWTNPGTYSVLCSCAATEIHENVVIRGGQEVLDEEDFKLAVSVDTGIPLDELRLRTS